MWCALGSIGGRLRTGLVQARSHLLDALLLHPTANGHVADLLSPVDSGHNACVFHHLLQNTSKIVREIKEDNLFATESFHGSAEPCVRWLLTSFPRVWQRP